MCVAGGSVGWYYLQENEKQAKLNETADVLYEEIKQSYEKEDFDSVKKELAEMKAKYSTTPAYAKASSDFGDFEKKVKKKEEQKKEHEQKESDKLWKQRKVEWEENAQELINGYTDLLRGIPGVKDVFENVNANGSRVTILVNNNWYVLSNDAKKEFIKRAVVLYWGRLNGSSSMPSWKGYKPDFKFVNEINSSVVATWDSSLGTWLHD